MVGALFRPRVVSFFATTGCSILFIMAESKIYEFRVLSRWILAPLLLYLGLSLCAYAVGGLVSGDPCILGAARKHDSCLLPLIRLSNSIELCPYLQVARCSGSTLTDGTTSFFIEVAIYATLGTFFSFAGLLVLTGKFVLSWSDQFLKLGITKRETLSRDRE